MHPTYPHVRHFKGIKSTPLSHWQNTPLKGSYLVESTLESPSEGASQAVILCSGAFDPFRGSYSEKTIRGILDRPNISAVYEVHFFHENQPGKLDPATYIEDLSLIYRTENTPIMIGMSASTWMLTSAMYNAQKRTEKTDSKKTLLIGAAAPGHLSLLGRCLSPFYSRKSMHEKIAHHCGHPHTIKNSDAIDAWWDSNPEIRQAVHNKVLQGMAPQFGTQMDLLYFKFDTLSFKGKRLFKNFCGASTLEEKIPKHHRSLLDIPEVDAFLPKYCETA